jgi:hypothetical protein
MSKQTKKITLEALAATMEAGFKRMDTGFKRVDDKMDAGFKKAEENRESLARMIANGFEHTATKEDIARLEKGQTSLEQGQENIQLRVESLAPYFEVKHLERRVKRLEDRAGIRHSIQH